MSQNEFELAMQELRAEYMRLLPDHIADIELAWRDAQSEDWNGERFRTLIRLAHNLAGSGATYGVAPVSGAARALELYARSLDDTALPREDARMEVDRLLANLRACIAS